MQRRNWLAAVLGGAVGAGVVRGSEPELKPCPWCGGKAEFYEFHDYDWSTIQCSKCESFQRHAERGSDGHEFSTAYFDTRAEAVSAWNRRA